MEDFSAIIYLFFLSLSKSLSNFFIDYSDKLIFKFNESLDCDLSGIFAGPAFCDGSYIYIGVESFLSTSTKLVVLILLSKF